MSERQPEGWIREYKRLRDAAIHRAFEDGRTYVPDDDESFAMEEARAALDAHVLGVAPAVPQPDAWLPIEGAQSLKQCPRCGCTCLEGETQCGCGAEPADDVTWRNVRAASPAPADPPQPRLAFEWAMNGLEEIAKYHCERETEEGKDCWSNSGPDVSPCNTCVARYALERVRKILQDPEQYLHRDEIAAPAIPQPEAGLRKALERIADNEGDGCGLWIEGDCLTNGEADPCHPCVARAALAAAPPPAARDTIMVHGSTCPKVSHEGLTGTMHGPNDDTPYDVDGVRYCGRCHEALQVVPSPPAAQPSSEPQVSVAPHEHEWKYEDDDYGTGAGDADYAVYRCTICREKKYVELPD